MGSATCMLDSQQILSDNGQHHANFVLEGCTQENLHGMANVFSDSSRQVRKENHSGDLEYDLVKQHKMIHTHIIAVADGVFVTRSIRRSTSAFDVKYFTDLTTCPWECNYAALGHTMMHAKRVLAPVPVPSMIDANLAPPPMLTASVPYTPDESAFDPPTPGETKSSPAPTTPGVVTSRPSPSDSKSEDASQAGKVSSKAKEEGSNEPITSSLQSSPSSATQAMDESTRPEHERPATEDSSRAPKQLRMNVISYPDMHEDTEPDLSQDAFG